MAIILASKIELFSLTIIIFNSFIYLLILFGIKAKTDVGIGFKLGIIFFCLYNIGILIEIIHIKRFNNAFYFFLILVISLKLL